MNPKELRYGNWIIIDGHRMQVTALGIHTILEGESTAEGIPLTPEILGKCGFFRNEYEKWMFNHKDRLISLFEDMQNNIRVRGIESQPIVKSLHQLQNLYFALVGEELKYTP